LPELPHGELARQRLLRLAFELEVLGPRVSTQLAVAFGENKVDAETSLRIGGREG